MEVDRKTIGILLEILQIGLGISSIVIFCEFGLYYLHDRNEKEEVIDGVSDLLAAQPVQIYIGEFGAEIAAVHFINVKSNFRDYL